MPDHSPASAALPADVIGIVIAAAGILLTLLWVALFLLASRAHPIAPDVLHALTSPIGPNAPTT